MNNIQGLFTWGVQQLIDKPTDTPKLDAERLLLEVLQVRGISKIDFYTQPQRAVPNSDIIQFEKFIKRRALGEPVASIIGHQAFWSLALKVSPDTLIPRPETELLVEIILEKRKALKASVLDLGTGTGAIALALAKERSSWSITATDISQETLEIAKQNAKFNNLDINFRLGSWFEAVPNQVFSIIVSNPPYIAEGDSHLNHPNLSFEPRRALVSGDRGLKDIREIIHDAPLFLQPQGLLVLEHGYDQKLAVQSLFAEFGFTAIETQKDLSGLDRCTFGFWRPLF